MKREMFMADQKCSFQVYLRDAWVESVADYVGEALYLVPPFSQR